ncbi:MAG: acyl-CoA thioesterase [Syntrophobacterales bacterium]|nr:acyl-CoA thioesterase [Syntrophobacterales bacterium]
MGKDKEMVSMKDFPLKLTLPVLWGHMDAFQHVNNVVYFRYLESARIAYFEEARLMKFMEETGVGPILAETSCRYIRPLRFPDTIEVGCRTTVVRDSEMEQEYALYSQRQERIVAIGWALIVAYDYKILKRAKWSTEFLERVKVYDPQVKIEVQI